MGIPLQACHSVVHYLSHSPKRTRRIQRLGTSTIAIAPRVQKLVSIIVNKELSTELRKRYQIVLIKVNKYKQAVQMLV